MPKASSSWAEAERVFGDMGDERDLVSWSSMISCYGNNHTEFEAVDTFVHMSRMGFSLMIIVSRRLLGLARSRRMHRLVIRFLGF